MSTRNDRTELEDLLRSLEFTYEPLLFGANRVDGWESRHFNIAIRIYRTGTTVRPLRGDFHTSGCRDFPGGTFENTARFIAAYVLGGDYVND